MTGRPPAPRLTPEASTALLESARAGGTRIALARRLGISRQALHTAYAHGLTEAQAQDWMARIASPSESSENFHPS